MNTSLFVFGLAKALFGVLVGGVGIFAAARVLHRMIGSKDAESATAEGNVAVGILKAGSLVALGILLQHAVTSTFNAMDLMYRDAEITMVAVRRVATYALIHVGVSILVSAIVLALGTAIFMRLTRNVDEMAEIL